jgi:hypothetical protein
LTQRRIDDLEFPELPQAIPEIGEGVPTLALSGTAAGRPFLIEGDVAAVSGSLRSGCERVRISGTLAAANFRLVGSLGVNFVASPGSLRREIVADGATTVESVVIAPTLPLVVAQWTPSIAARPPVEVTLLPDCADVSFAQNAGVIIARDADRPETQVAAGLHGSDAAWEVVESDAPGLTVRHGMPSMGFATLLLSAGSTQKIRAAFGAAAHLRAHTARATEAPYDVVRTLTGIPSLDDGIGWLTTRLGRSLRRGSPSRMPQGQKNERLAAVHAFWSGAGAVAAGDSEGASLAMSLLEGATEAEADGIVDWPSDLLAPLLAARIGLALGDTRQARVHAKRLLSSQAAPLTAAGHDVRALAAHSLADALRYAESEERLGQLRALAATPRANGHRGLPMLHAPRPGTASFLEQCWTEPLTVRGNAPPTGHSELDRILAEWAHSGTDPEVRWTALRATLSAGQENGPAGPGSWDEEASSTLPGAPVAGAILAALVHGLIGYTPDAPSGRARLAPAFPGHLTAFHIQNLRLGESSLSLRYHRKGSDHRFELSPEIAKVPPMIVFEPTVDGARLTRATIDGVAAELDAQVHGNRTRVSVQIPLDSTRTVEFQVT